MPALRDILVAVTGLPAIPVLLLDVDGVINVSRPAWPDKDAYATVYADGTGYPFRWSPALITELAQLHRDQIVEIRWCSTWCAHAATLNDLWSLHGIEPAWTGVFTREQTRAVKLNTAKFELDSGRRLIWIDDEAIPPAKTRRACGMTGDALYITPTAHTGLAPAHIRQIRRFAAAAVASAA